MKNKLLVFALILITGIVVFAISRDREEEKIEPLHKTRFRSYIPTSCGFSIPWPTTIAKEPINSQWEYSEVAETTSSIKASMMFRNAGIRFSCEDTNVEIDPDSYTNIWGELKIETVKEDDIEKYYSVVSTNNESKLVEFELINSNSEIIETDIDTILNNLKITKSKDKLIIPTYE